MMYHKLLINTDSHEISRYTVVTNSESSFDLRGLVTFTQSYMIYVIIYQ